MYEITGQTQFLGSLPNYVPLLKVYYLFNVFTLNSSYCIIVSVIA